MLPGQRSYPWPPPAPPPTLPPAGTEKQAVAEDYHRLLHKGWAQAAAIVNKALTKLIFPDSPAPSTSDKPAQHAPATASAQAEELASVQRRLASSETAQSAEAEPKAVAGAAPAILLDQCPLLNASICEPTMAASQAHLPFLLVAYNPLAQARTEYVRVPVVAGPVAYSVEGEWLGCAWIGWLARGGRIVTLPVLLSCAGQHHSATSVCFIRLIAAHPPDPRVTGLTATRQLPSLLVLC